MQANSPASGEINLRCAWRRFYVCEQSAAAQFEIGNHAVVRLQGPFESEGVHSRAVSGTAFLNDKKCRNNIHRIFQTAAEKSRTVRRSENQAVAQAEIPDAVGGLTPVCTVATSGPDLEFVAAFNGTCLRTGGRCKEKSGKEDGGDRSIQRRVSFRAFDSRHVASGADEDIELSGERRISSISFEVGADDLNDIVGGFFGRLRIARHVIADVVFHQFGHEAIDGAASGGEALERVGARFIFVEGAKNAFELADDFLGAVDEVEFFARSMGHFSLAYPIGVWYQDSGLKEMASRTVEQRAGGSSTAQLSAKVNAEGAGEGGETDPLTD